MKVHYCVLMLQHPFFTPSKRGYALNTTWSDNIGTSKALQLREEPMLLAIEVFRTIVKFNNTVLHTLSNMYFVLICAKCYKRLMFTT